MRLWPVRARRTGRSPTPEPSTLGCRGLKSSNARASWGASPKHPFRLTLLVPPAILARPVGPTETDALEIAFKTRELRTLCEIHSHARGALGEDTAIALKRRLADIRAAATVADLVVGRPRLCNDSTACMMLDLGSTHRLVFCANHPSNPTSEAGDVDWLRVSRVRIEALEQHND